LSKPKATTLQQRFGFADPDLTTASHDAIMSWLDQAITEQPALWLPTPPDWNDQIAECLQGMPRGADYERLMTSVPSAPSLRDLTIVKKIWEAPVTGTRDFMIGFFDMKVVYTFPLLGLRGRDMMNLNWYVAREWNKEIAFEVKTTIPSLGELFRQLSMYRLHFDGKIVVVSHDDRHATTILDQGYGFIRPNMNRQDQD
jgi:hypothetical protein